MKLKGRSEFLHLDFYHFQGMLLTELIVKKGVPFTEATQFIHNAHNRTLRLDDGRVAVAPTLQREVEPSHFNASSIYFTSISEINRSRYTIVQCTISKPDKDSNQKLDCKVPAPAKRRCEKGEPCTARTHLQTCPRRRPVYLGHELGPGCREEELLMVKDASKYDDMHEEKHAEEKQAEKQAQQQADMQTDTQTNNMHTDNMQTDNMQAGNTQGGKQNLEITHEAAEAVANGGGDKSANGGGDKSKQP